jgi:hypothetical protein
MTTGALIFAYNNEQIDYVSMAAWTARNIRRHLNIPVALVTDNAQAVDNPDFAHVNVIESTSTNQRYFPDFEKRLLGTILIEQMRMHSLPGIRL